MGKPHPVELRERVIAFAEEGHMHRAATSHFRVSPRFVNNMVILKQEAGPPAPKRQGRHGVEMAVRNFNAISDALGQICELYTASQCHNYFKAAGYEAD